LQILNANIYFPAFGGGFPSAQPQQLFPGQQQQPGGGGLPLNMFSVGAAAAAPRRSQIRARRFR